MITPCRARNVISLILLAGPIGAPRYASSGALIHAGGQSLIQQHDVKFTLSTNTISSTTHIGGVP
jgi:hypothetical protein